MDNAAAFRSERMASFLERWGVKPCFRAIYRASGNGIVERHHRTIKSIAEKAQISPAEAVFYYNVSPRKGQDPASVPQCSVNTYEWRLPFEVQETSSNRVVDAPVKIGDEVWVRPSPNVRCTSLWNRGKVTAINSTCNVDVDGLPRHILDLRRVQSTSDVEEPEQNMEQEDGFDSEVEQSDENQDLHSQPSVLEVVSSEHEDNEDVQAESMSRYPRRDRRPPAWMADYTQ